MKRLLVLFSFASFLSAPTAFAQSPYASYQHNESYSYRDNFPNWYLGLNGSVNFVGDAQIDGQTQDFDTGGGGNVAIGYRPYYTNSFLDNTRFELSLGYYVNEANVDNAELQNITPFFNAYYDFNAQGNFKPYLGVGLGATIGTFDNKTRYLRGFLTDGDGDGFADSIAEGDPDLGTNDSPEYLVDEAGNFIPVYAEANEDDDVVFAYQLMAGFAYEFESVEDVEFVMGYRFIDSMDMSFSIPGASSSYITPNGIAPAGNVADMNVETDYQAHSIDIGFRFRF